MNERHGRGLAELAELGLALARDLQARALAAPEMAEAADLALAFHRISRSVRQTYALEARLERDARRGLVEDSERAAKARKAEQSRREDHVRTAVSRLIWTEAEEEDADGLTYELKDLIVVEALSEAFLTDPIETIVARIRADLGLPPAAEEGQAVVAGPALQSAPAEGPSAQGPPPPALADVWT